MSAKSQILLIAEETDNQWALVLRQALSALGEIQGSSSEEDAVQAVIRKRYDVIIIDAGTIHSIFLLVSRLHVLQKQARIIVASASPMWQQARGVLRAGATDYIYKSLSQKELRSNFQAVLENSPPPASRHSDSRR